MRLLTIAACAVVALAQTVAPTGHRKVTENAQSPTAGTSMSLGGHAVTIEYNAPSVRGRKVEGGLVPYGSVWRLGADSATTLTTDADITIGRVKVPKGVYTLYIMASPDDWKLIINKETGQWGTEYNEPQDLGRTSLKLSKLSPAGETLKITLTASGPSAGTLDIAWGGTRATVPVKIG